MPREMIRNPNGSRVVANEKVGMGTQQNTYFQENIAKPSQVLVAAANPNTLEDIAKVKQALMQRTMNGVWRAIGLVALGTLTGFALVFFDVEISPFLVFLTVVLAAIAVALYVGLYAGNLYIAAATVFLGVTTVAIFGEEYFDVFQSVAVAVWFLIAGAPLYIPLIHGALHASKYSSPMTSLLYTIEDKIQFDITGDGVKGDPGKRHESAVIEQEQSEIDININGKPVAHEPAIPHVVTRQVLISPFNTERQTGLYTPAQALDFYILVSKEARYMDRNNIYGHGLQVGSMPRRIDLTKNAHDDLKAGLYALGAIVRVSGKYKSSGKPNKEVAELLKTACKSITEEF